MEIGKIIKDLLAGPGRRLTALQFSQLAGASREDRDGVM